VRSERLFAELEELSTCRAAVRGEVNLSEVPDLEQVDLREALRENRLRSRLTPATTGTAADDDDDELE